MEIKIENLRLRTVVGIFEWEKEVKQDVVINVDMHIDGDLAVTTDNIEDTVDYKQITKNIINHVEDNSFNLIEKIAGDIANLVMKDNRVRKTIVKVDKPGALRFADSVSVTHQLEK